jgi:hypothetical protein
VELPEGYIGGDGDGRGLATTRADQAWHLWFPSSGDQRRSFMVLGVDLGCQGGGPRKVGGAAPRAGWRALCLPSSCRGHVGNT